MLLSPMSFTHIQEIIRQLNKALHSSEKTFTYLGLSRNPGMPLSHIFLI